MRSPKPLVGAVVLGAAGTYLLLWLAVAAGWHPLESVDNSILRGFRELGVNRPAWVGFWNAVSGFLNVLRFVAVVGIVVELFRRRVRTAVFLILTVLGMGVVTESAKALTERPRPDTALTVVSSTAFPSGHALGMTVGVLALITVLWPRMTTPMRRLAAGAGVVAIAVVSVARVALNVHHPSDVVAGWALGILYFMLCAALVRPWRQTERPSQDSGLAAPD